jgi:peptidoglycan/xylan/chitin deacetylase (PgdA/CDA1 family)
MMSMAAVEPVLWLVRRQLRAGRIPCLMYHEVLADDAGAGLWTVVRAGDFERQLRYLLRHYTPLSIDEAVHEYRRHRRWPNGAVLITFDDGYAGNLNTVLPIVQSQRVPVTVYVATRWVQDGRLHWFDRMMVYLAGQSPVQVDLRDYGGAVFTISGHADTEHWWNDVSAVLGFLKSLPEDVRGRAVDQVTVTAFETDPAGHLAPLTIAQLRELADSDLVTIGAHSHEHEILTGISLKAARQSVTRSRDLLEQWTGSAVRHFAYPNGNHSHGLANMLQDISFDTAVTTRPGLWKPDDNLLELPRIGIGRFDPGGYFRTRTAGLVM